jgi:hypothetical protein
LEVVKQAHLSDIADDRIMPTHRNDVHRSFQARGTLQHVQIKKVLSEVDAVKIFLLETTPNVVIVGALGTFLNRRTHCNTLTPGLQRLKLVEVGSGFLFENHMGVLFVGSPFQVRAVSTENFHFTFGSWESL